MRGVQCMLCSGLVDRVRLLIIRDESVSLCC